MTSTLLSLVQTVQAELNLFPQATSVSGATDDQTIQLFTLINAVGRELMVERDWRSLEEEGIISVIPPVTTTGNTTQQSAVVTGIGSLTGVAATTWVCQGQTIAQAARVVSVDSSSQVTLNEQSTATLTGISLTFSQDTYAIPADFSHFVNGTAWDRTRRWQLLGPTSPQEDQWMRSGIAAIGPRRRFRQVGRGVNSFRIWPPPATTDTPSTLVFDYISSYWAQDTNGVPKAAFTADTDTCVYPDDVMIKGLKYKFFLVKGFDVSTYRAEYMQARDVAMAQDGGARTVRMGRKRWPVLISGANIPDAGFGSATGS